TQKDVDRLHVYYPAVPRVLFEKVAAHINAGATGRDRSDRLTDCATSRIDLATGVPMERSPSRDYVRGLAEKYAVIDASFSVAGRPEAHDAHRDRQNGIDRNREAVEKAKQASMSDDAIRKRDVERAFAQHE